MKIIIAMLVAALPLAAHGQLLKCVGKDGRVEYASQCPPGTKEQQTGIKSSTGGPAPSTAGKSQQKSAAEMEADFRKRRTEQAEAQGKADKEAAEKAQRDRACQDARSYLSSLESGARVSRTDPRTGERVFLEDSARAQEISVAQQSVQNNCK